MASGRIKGITIEIDGDTTKLTNAIKKSEQQIRQSTSNLKDIDKLLKLDPGNTDLLTQKYKNLQTELDGAKDKLTKLKEAQEQMVREGKVGTDEYDALQREIVETEQKVKSLTKEMRNFGSVSAQQIAAAGEKFQKAGTKISDLGSSMTRNVTTPIVTGFGAAIKVAGDFEEQMAKVSSIAQAYGEDLEKLKQNAMDLSEGTRFSATEIAQAYEYMGMAGWNTNQILAGTPGILNLATASGEDLANVSDIVTDGLTAFGLTADDTTRFVNVLAEAARSSNTNVGLMGESFKYVGPVAGSMGYEIEDVAVALGLMANSGIKGSMAGTSLRNMLQRMAKPTKESQMAMDRLGLSLTDGSGRMLSLQQIMDQLRGSMGQINMPLTEYNAKLDELDKALEDGTIKQKAYDQELEELNLQAFGAEGAEKARAAAMLGGTRAMAALMAVSSATEEDYNNLTAAIQNSGETMVRTADGAVKPLSEALANGDEIMEEYEGTAAAMAGTMNDTANVQMKELLNQTQVIAIELGKTLLPIFKDVLSVLSDWVSKFKELTPEQQEMIVKIGLIAAALGPVLIVIGKVITAIGTIMTFVPQIVGGIGAVITFITGTAIPAIGAFVAAIGAPVLIAIGLVIAAGYEVIKHWDEIKEAGALLVERTQEHWENIKNNVTEAASTLKERTEEHFENLKQGISDRFEQIAEAGNTLKERTIEHFENIKQGISERFDMINEAANTLKERTTEHFETLKNNLQEKFNTISEAVNTFKDQTVEHFENFKNSVREKFQNVQEAANAFKERIRENFDSVKQKVTDAINAVKQKFEDMKAGLNSAIDNVKSKLDSFKQKFDDIKSHIQSVVDWLKNCFHFDWKLPDLKLPHISISGSFSIDPPSAPHFSIDWYAKAMEKGMILNSPTIFGAMGGKLLGAGEAGSEAIVGTSSLQNMITSAVAAGGYGGDIVIPVYIGNTRLETMVVKAQQINDYRSGGR